MDLRQVGTRARDSVQRRPVLGDTLLALGVVVIAVAALRINPQDQPQSPPTTADVIGFFLSLLAVVTRRRHNLVALVATVAVAIGFIAVDHRQQVMLTAAIALLLYTFATRTDRRMTWLTAAGIAVLLFLAGTLWKVAGWDSLGTVAWIGMGTAIGDATRSRRAYVAEVEDRARRAEQSRDEEARLRVAQERMRIARELHDVVAHHIAVIKVQASGAKHILAHRPDQVAPALDNISRSSDAALKEMASVVGLLRNSSDLDVTPDANLSETEPTRGLARLSGLLDDFTSAGLRVEHRQIGVARELPALADLAAYRIAQESLTNAQKYGDGTVRLTIAYTADLVTVDITNTIGGRTSGRGSGFGIVGMRERATANGGSFVAGPAGHGCFTVHAELPAPTEEIPQ